MSEIEKGNNVINLKVVKAEKKRLVNRIAEQTNPSSLTTDHEADLYLHPSLNSLLGLDKEPDYIINVDPNKELDFEFSGGEKWPQTPIEERDDWHASPLHLGEIYELPDLYSLKILFGDLLARCEHPKHVIEVDLCCHPRFDTEYQKIRISFGVEVKARYSEKAKESRCIPEFWYEYSQRMFDYLYEHYEKAITQQEKLILHLRYNKSGLFWELENPFHEYW